MIDAIFAIIGALVPSLGTREQLVFENLAMWHETLVLKRKEKQPKLKTGDRLLWVSLRTG